MRIPRRVTIGAHDIPVRYVKDFRHYETGESLLGAWHSAEREIMLNAKLQDYPDNELVIFFHECLHVLNDILTLNIDEVTVDRLGEGLTALLKQNKLLKD